MTRKTEIQFEQPRRRDRAIKDEEWIGKLLAHAAVGVLATVGPEGPSLNPNLFVFEPTSNSIYLHTARNGQTRDNVERDPRVAFSVHEMGRILPASAAVDFSVEYASVVLTGRCSLVEDPDEAKVALERLMRKYAPHLEPGRDYQDIRETDLARTSVLRLDADSWSAKGKAVDMPEGYTYDPARSTSQNPSADGSQGGFAAALSSYFHQALWAGLRSRSNERR